MTNSDLTQGDDLQQLQAVRHDQLSCLFDADSKLQALPPPSEAKPQVRRGSQKPLGLPNHNPIPVDSTAAAMQALGLGKPRRNNPGGSKRQGQPPTQVAQTQQQPRLPTQAELAAMYGQPQAPQPLQPTQVQHSPQSDVVRRPPPQRVTLFSLWRRVKHYALTHPQECGKELAQYVAFVVLGGSVKFFAPDPSVVPILMGLALLTIVGLFLFRPGWREQGLTACLLLGLCLSGFL